MVRVVLGGKMAETIVNAFEELPLIKNEKHRGVYYKNCVSMDVAKYSGINVSRIIYERIDPEGQVLPHTHEVGEIIHITGGEVSLLLNGVWTDFVAGDTFIVPAGNIHSVKNRRKDIPSEQISCFVPRVNKLAEGCKGE